MVKSLCRMHRLLVLGSLLLLAVSLPAVARASSWSWGFNYVGPYTSVGNCPWYNPGSVCGPWETDWGYVGMDKTSGGTVHVGFENSSAIRGHFDSGSVVDYVYVSETGLSGLITPESTYWSGDTSYLQLAAH